MHPGRVEYTNPRMRLEGTQQVATADLNVQNGYYIGLYATGWYLGLYKPRAT